MQRVALKIEGTVQGVGFRPFIYRLARRHSLGGKVWNAGEGVMVEIEGRAERVQDFIKSITAEAPALARITGIEMEELAPLGYAGFAIIHSQGVAEGRVIVPPDVATCGDCRQDILNPTDRHYRYPFTNCTNCGPRFTIVRGLPYDREKTSMRDFPMCAACAAEYTNPLDRRFHAQPVACPACGPQVSLVDRQGRQLPGDWLALSRTLLAAGQILAIKGLGGFHLACDARNQRAIRELRERKNRPHKPLAVMGRDLETVAEHCQVDPVEAGLLTSPAAPIVVLRKKPGCRLPEELAPGQASLGVMLPYTPLHILLMAEGPSLLVMTSGNYSEMPLCIDNQEALESLSPIADYFLWHNRPIVNRCDDSVVTIVAGETQFYRRSRGYVPSPMEVPVDGQGRVTVLGAGSDLKNTFCILKDGRAFLSQHIGDLGSLEGEANYQESLAKFKALLNAGPRVVAFDLHPGYQSSLMARAMGDVVHIAVQHHHAHLAACMAENYLNEPVIGVILDGTGYGVDGCSWGFEVLRGDYLQFKRELHLDYVPLPGGDNAVRHPWRTAVAYLYRYCGAEAPGLASRFFADKGEEIEILARAIQAGLNAPLAGSCGRLFDAVAALLGVCQDISYEGQAAVELSNLVPWPAGVDTEELARDLSPYPFEIKEGVISPRLIITGVLADLEQGVPKEVIARRFHDSVIAMVVEALKSAARASGPAKVVFSGGSWQNHYLLTLAKYCLEEIGYQVFVHHRVPPNDGGLSLGQALVGYWRWKQYVCRGTDAGPNS
ncbi:MAG: hydrogenase maturation protein HypF [Clostridia bacterium]|nr:hydrogenase maturation protein HypF [Clostridia bacterium]